MLTAVALASCLLPSAAQDGSTAIANLGLDPLAITVRDGVLFFSVDEEDLGTDLNGDGDTGDRVAHVYFSESGVLRNLGVALAGGGQRQRQDDLIAIPVSESAQQVDLNGDGDTADDVLHLYSIQADSLTNLGLSTLGFFSPGFSGELLLISAVENAALGADYNSDGDFDDNALFVYDPTSGQLHASGFACDGFTIDGSMGAVGGFALFGVPEADQGGTDLNGDGDTLDSIVHAFDTGTGVVTNLLLPELSIRSDGYQVGTTINESLAAQDLNADGDLFDTLLYVFDPGATMLVATGAIIDSTQPLVQSRGHFAHLVREGLEGVDLNGDGDVQCQDRGLYVYDTTVNALTLYPFAARDVEIDHPFVVFTLNEEAQQADANFDGDANDDVVHVLDLRDGSVRNLGLATDGLGTDKQPWSKTSLDDAYLYIAVDETDQAFGDLNGDGDHSDDVAFVYELLSGTLTNLGIGISGAGSSPFRVRDGRAAFCLFERSQGVDANGDGDTKDKVMHLFDPCTGALENLGLALGGLAQVLGGDVLAVAVSEPDQGGTDLNDDGDATDSAILFVATTPPAGDAVNSIGPGTQGSGGFEPVLSGFGCPHPGGVFAFRAENALGGAVGALAISTSRADLQLLGGTLYPFPFELFLPFVYSGGAGVAGAGHQLVLPGNLDVSLAGLTFFAQTACLDPNAIGGLSLSNGLEVSIGLR